MVGTRSRFTFLLTFLAFIVSAPPAHSATNVLGRFVQRVADGDTVTLVTHDGAKLRVRLYGIDAPEDGDARGRVNRSPTGGHRLERGIRRSAEGNLPGSGRYIEAGKVGLYHVP